MLMDVYESARYVGKIAGKVGFIFKSQAIGLVTLWTYNQGRKQKRYDSKAKIEPDKSAFTREIVYTSNRRDIQQTKKGLWERVT